MSVPDTLDQRQAPTGAMPPNLGPGIAAAFANNAERLSAPDLTEAPQATAKPDITLRAFPQAARA